VAPLADIGRLQGRRRTALKNAGANFAEPRSECGPTPLPSSSTKLSRVRSYRDRKDLYTKSLESELAKTRLRESNLVRECEHLQNTVNVLLERMSQYGIDTPPELGHDGGNAFVPKTAQQLASPVSSSALGSTEDGRERGISHRAHPSQRELPPLPRSPRALLSGGSSNDQLCNLDPVMVGMEFVLT
jgi:hypothetical protein